MLISPEYRDFVAVAVMFVAAAGFTMAAIILPLLLGPRRTHGPLKDSPYECGLPPLGDPARFSVKFCVIAMLFILFDVEVVFLLGGAVLYRNLIKPVSQGGIGWPMLIGVVVFLLILEVGHVYALKKGALSWAPARSKRRSRPTP